MGYAEKIYAQVKHLPEQVAREVFDFVEFLSARQAGGGALSPDVALASRRHEIEQAFAKYQVDLSGFDFDREQANARR
jgi:hypothetical protein